MQQNASSLDEKIQVQYLVKAKQEAVSLERRLVLRTESVPHTQAMGGEMIEKGHTQLDAPASRFQSPPANGDFDKISADDSRALSSKSGAVQDLSHSNTGKVATEIQILSRSEDQNFIVGAAFVPTLSQAEQNEQVAAASSKDSALPLKKDRKEALSQYLDYCTTAVIRLNAAVDRAKKHLHETGTVPISRITRPFRHTKRAFDDYIDAERDLDSDYENGSEVAVECVPPPAEADASSALTVMSHRSYRQSRRPPRRNQYTMDRMIIDADTATTGASRADDEGSEPIGFLTSWSSRDPPDPSTSAKPDTDLEQTMPGGASERERYASVDEIPRSVDAPSLPEELCSLPTRQSASIPLQAQPHHQSANIPRRGLHKVPIYKYMQPNRSMARPLVSLGDSDAPGSNARDPSVTRPRGNDMQDAVVGGLASRTIPLPRVALWRAERTETSYQDEAESDEETETEGDVMDDLLRKWTTVMP